MHRRIVEGDPAADEALGFGEVAFDPGALGEKRQAGDDLARVLEPLGEREEDARLPLAPAPARSGRDGTT